MERPNDRLHKISGKDTIKTSSPKIVGSAELKIPDKELNIMKSESDTPGSGTCSCNSVCACVPVSECACDSVCTCDNVCSSNSCTCDVFTGCSTHTCTCQPVGGGCSRTCFYCYFY